MNNENVSKDEIILKLQEEVEMLRTVISIMPGHFFWKDVNGRYLGCNNHEAKLFGLNSPEEIIGKEDSELIGPELAEKMQENNLQVMLSKQENSFEEHAFNAGKNTAVYLTKKVPILGKNNELKGILGVSFDITDRKNMEQKLLVAKQKAEAANRAKSRFLAMISHELRTPLTSILGFTKLIEKDDMELERKQEYLQHISSSGNYLLSLINSLLDYNKLETNKFELMYTPLNLHETIKDVVSMLSGSAKIKNLQLNFSYDNKAAVEVMSSTRIIRQILINLIGNAIKFTTEGQIDIEVKSISETEHVSRLEISISDTGIGIPVDEHQSIFKRFYQLGNIYTQNTNLAGTGLGLAIVKRLVKLLGGKIKVESIPGKGSRFYFVTNFPKVLLEQSPLLACSSQIRMLVINDNNGNYYSQYLTNICYDVISSKEALDMLSENHSHILPYDLILIDPEILTIAPAKLKKMLLEYVGDHNILIILLTFSAGSEWNICHNPSKEKIKKFQTSLKSIWENKKIENKSYFLNIPRKKQPRVLLLEDNKLIQIIHKKLLEDLNCIVDIAESVPEAVSLLSNQYDILFVDIGLPEIAGFEFIKTIRKLDNEIANTPIIVVTGYSEEEEKQYCLRVGANDVLVKPINENVLQQVIDLYTQKEFQSID